MYEQISPDTSHIRYEETDLSYLKLRPYRFKCGIYLICIQGKSIISTGVQQYAFDEQTELIFLTGSLIQIIYNPQIEMFARFKMKSSFHKTKRII